LAMAQEWLEQHPVAEAEGATGAEAGGATGERRAPAEGGGGDTPPQNKGRTPPEGRGAPQPPGTPGPQGRPTPPPCGRGAGRAGVCAWMREERRRDGEPMCALIRPASDEHSMRADLDTRSSDPASRPHRERRF